MGKRLAMVMAGLISFGWFATPAGAMTPKPVAITTCGQVITTDAVLKVDLRCAGTALTVTGPDVTVELGHHRLTSTDGLGAGIALALTPPTGPEAWTCAGNVTITGGTISGFLDGISNPCSPGSPTSPRTASVVGTTLTGNTWGAFVTGGALLRIDRSAITGTNGLGGGLIGSQSYSSANMVVTRSTIQTTGTAYYEVSGELQIDSSHVAGGAFYGVWGGIKIADSQLVGVAVGCPGDGGLILTGDHLDGGSVGGSEACGMSVTDSRFVGPGFGTGLDVGGHFGTPEVIGNTFTGWTQAVTVGAAPTTITGNTFRHNVNGIVGCPSGSCAGGTLTGNTLVDNSGTGVSLGGGPWTIGSNTFLRNGGLGIDAEGPDLMVTDVGGDIARHNAAPQCIGIICTSVHRRRAPV